MVKQAICVASMVMMMVGAVLGFGEPDKFGHPNWVEATNLVYTNAARIDPLGYKSKYGWRFHGDISQMFLKLGATTPLSWEPLLGKTALDHSTDMAVTPCFAHDSCNGQGVFDRILATYTCGWSGIAENIAAGTSDPWDLTDVWLCDGNDQGCASDDNAGHRQDIMGGYTIIGIGYFVQPGSPYGSYATQDFIGGGPCVPYTSPIYAGSHHSIGSTLSFITIFYQGTTSNVPAAPQSATVVIEGYVYNLALDLGKPGQALYNYSTTYTYNGDCQHYYFSFVDSQGKQYRYPDTGFLLTYGLGTCQSYFSTTGPATIGTSGAPPPTPTVAPTVAPKPGYPIYIGCYVDASTRDLPNQVTTIATGAMTVKLCETACLAQNYAYAGLQYSGECRCGNSYGSKGKAANTDCAMKCRGNSSEFCGAGWRNSIYQVADAPSKVLADGAGNDAVRGVASVFVVLCVVLFSLVM